MCPFDSLVWRVGEGEELVVNCDTVVLELCNGVLSLHLGVVHVDERSILHQHIANGQRRSLTHVAGVLLERETEDCNLLPGDGVEQGLYDPARERLLLVLVHVDHLLPVLSALVQAELLADVHEVQDVLLEAGAAESDRGVQELLPDAAVGADGPGHLADVGTRALAEPGDGVDAADALGEHGPRSTPAGTQRTTRSEPRAGFSGAGVGPPPMPSRAGSAPTGAAREAPPVGGDRRRPDSSARSPEGAARAVCGSSDGVGDQLRELGAPEVGGEDPLAGHPVRVDVHEHLHRLLHLAPDEHPVRAVEVRHGRTLGQELWVRQDVEPLPHGPS
ncbi:unnamed protein product [Prorocentrum cordatum]|uniref:Uncharacterized protein n=1 Tax=Prorocentrum cordatum TaxID=2364126 RepID=A0ABN9TCC0_9DINO|nr:unnamed protein product [Polarella glacialis]